MKIKKINKINKDILLVIIFFLVLVPGIYIFDNNIFEEEILLEGFSDEIILKDSVIKIQTKYKTEELLFTSSDEKIATVDKEGKVTSVSDGEGKINIKKKNSNATQTVTIVIKNDSTSTNNTETKNANIMSETLDAKTIASLSKTNWKITKERITSTDNLVCADVEENIEIYRDTEYIYYAEFSCSYITHVEYDNGTKHTFPTVLNNKLLSVRDLEKSGVIITKKYLNSAKNWTLSYNSYNQIVCTQSVVTLYEDDKYFYQIPDECYGSYVYVIYDNGERITIASALKQKKITIDELIEKGYVLYKVSKTDWTLDYSPIKELICTEVLEEATRDNECIYYYSNGCQSLVEIVYSDGTRISVSSALKSSKVSPAELKNKGFNLYTEKISK